VRELDALWPASQSATEAFRFALDARVRRQALPDAAMTIDQFVRATHRGRARFHHAPIVE
jgi:hypothetical protein